MKHIFLVLFVLVFVGLNAQVDTTVFAAQKKVETAEYVLRVPELWRKLPDIDASSRDRKYEFSEVALPKMFNKTPLIAQFSLRKYVCDSIRAAEEFVVSELTSFPDRITEPGRNYAKDTITVESGEKAIIISTRYYRRTRVSNYSQFDMVVYSKKRKTAYMLNVTFQYRDPTYGIETDMKFREYALRVFKTLVLR
ncbi:MAG: hypothetical protein JWO06_399 [Bacteroidota bacterium]|nr:hypothetical protein [Bacteroidota bacterium]